MDNFLNASWQDYSGFLIWLDLSVASETGVLPALELNENERKIFVSVQLNDETSIDENIRASGLPSSAVNVALFSLEMKRLVKQLPGKLFMRNK